MSTLEEGQAFPFFSLSATVPNEGGIQESGFSLDDLRGRRAILFFYPKDATCGCTVEVCSFRDSYPQFQALNVQVIGVSRDTLRSHARFTRAQNLPYPLLSDSERTLAKECGLLRPKTMYGKPVVGSLRTTFALDENGVVLKVWRDVQPIEHVAQVLDFCRKWAQQGASQ